ncbi:protein kinase domain-containing protein, partial [Haematococcus lacustris]
PSILPLVLVCLIGFAAHKEHAGLITHTAALDLLCRIVHQYDLLFKRLAADLLALLARREEVIAELLAMNGLGRLVGQLPSGDPALTQSLLRVVCYLASDSAALTEIYQTGTIPVLLSLIASALKDWPSPGSNPALTSSKVIDMQLVCTALTRIAEDNELAYNIRQCNGITLLGKLLLLPGTSHGPQTDSGDKASAEMASLRAYAFRALRFLFSMERNRKVFKRLFPPDLFAAFIDLGHYNASLGAYSSLVMRLGDLSDKQRSALAAALDDVSADREGAEVVRTVRGGQYALIEMLGKGGYGAVWKAR